MYVQCWAGGFTEFSPGYDLGEVLKVRAGVEMCRACRKRISSEKNVVNLAPMSPVLAG